MTEMNEYERNNVDKCYNLLIEIRDRHIYDHYLCCDLDVAISYLGAILK